METEQDTTARQQGSKPGIIQEIRRNQQDYASFKSAWELGIRWQELRGFFRRIDPVDDFEALTKSAAESNLLESIVFGYTFAEKPIGVKNWFHRMMGLKADGYLTYLAAPYIITSNIKGDVRDAAYYGMLDIDDLGYRPVKSQSYRELILEKGFEMSETFNVLVQIIHLIE